MTWYDRHTTKLGQKPKITFNRFSRHWEITKNQRKRINKKAGKQLFKTVTYKA